MWKRLEGWGGGGAGLGALGFTLRSSDTRELRIAVVVANLPRRRWSQKKTADTV